MYITDVQMENRIPSASNRERIQSDSPLASETPGAPVKEIYWQFGVE